MRIQLATRTIIPVIDVFAGPGGLSEGFTRYDNPRFQFDVRLSIEKDRNACQTLALRKFYHGFDAGAVPDAYYSYVKGRITREELEEEFREEAEIAGKRAFLAELGGTSYPDELIIRRIKEALAGHRGHWGLIGGPPCQAYSMAGRSRMKPADEERYLQDHRHRLYQEYLKILAWFSPSFFIMENVPGLISTILNNQRVFDTILRDIEDPGNAIDVSPVDRRRRRPRYSVFSLVKERRRTLFGSDPHEPGDYIVSCEKFGVPQRRQRVILFGIREDITGGPGFQPPVLEEVNRVVSAGEVLEGLPPLRSGLSREEDSPELWRRAIVDQVRTMALGEEFRDVAMIMDDTLKDLRYQASPGGQFVPRGRKVKAHEDWYHDPNLGGSLNHEARSHMRTDLVRYLFLACAARSGKEMKLKDFPRILLPDHNNVDRAIDSGHGLFSDRFRVQQLDRPSRTVTSHLHKDGHYFIHPDPTQCRSMTVREAARLQTFPDSYFFEGPRTAQFLQVGNAVPPLLAHQIAGVVAETLGITG